MAGVLICINTPETKPTQPLEGLIVVVPIPEVVSLSLHMMYSAEVSAFKQIEGGGRTAHGWYVVQAWVRETCSKKIKSMKHYKQHGS